MMSIVCIGLGLSCAVLGYKWIQAERKASKLYDMVTEVCDQCDKVREELKCETMMADYYHEETVRLNAELEQIRTELYVEDMTSDHYYEETQMLKAELEQMREALNAEEMMSDYYYEKSVEAEQRNEFYEMLLCDVEVAYMSGEEYANYKEIIEQYKASFLEGYELVVGSNVVDLSIYRNRR